jgi:hypothetical protein
MARHAKVAELTASSRLPGVRRALGDSVLEGSPDAVLAVVGSGLFDVGASVGEGLDTEGDELGVVADGSAAGFAWAVSGRDRWSSARKVSSTTLSKTNPPMASFAGQWPFRKSGMRRSLTADSTTAMTTGQRRPPAGVAGPYRRPIQEAQ